MTFLRMSMNLTVVPRRIKVKWRTKTAGITDAWNECLQPFSFFLSFFLKYSYLFASQWSLRKLRFDMEFNSTTVEVHNPVTNSSYNFLKWGLCYFNKKSLSNTPRIYGFTHGFFLIRLSPAFYTTYCPVITDRLRKSPQKTYEGTHALWSDTRGCHL
jgi:hypothetical protein